MYFLSKCKNINGNKEMSSTYLKKYSKCIYFHSKYNKNIEKLTQHNKMFENILKIIEKLTMIINIYGNISEMYILSSKM